MASLPASIIITQGIFIPTVQVTEGDGAAPPAGLPPYPLTPDPSQTWWLTYAKGTLAWVASPVDPLIPMFALEDGVGVILLEDAEGVLTIEQ